MQRPDIGKRILPLLDIVFILLAFFIVLPHGVSSNEVVEISMLEKQNRQLQQELQYYHWKHGTNKTLSNKVHKILTTVVKNNTISITTNVLSSKNWQKELAEKINDESATFVIIRIEKDDEGIVTNTRFVEKLQLIMQKLNIVYIIEVDDNW